MRVTALFAVLAASLSPAAADLPDYRPFLAGGICAACSHGWTTPIDVVKTKIQSDPKKFDSGMLAATGKIVSEEGASALLAGLGPTVVGYGIEGAVKFGIYEALKPLSKKFIDSQAVAFLVASMVAGAAAAVTLCPMESVRIRLVTDSSFANGLLDGLPKLVKEEGFLEQFNGLAAMLLKQCPYTLGKQVSFDVFAGIFYGLVARMGMEGSEMKLAISVAAAFCASILACLSSQPGDMVLTKTYQDSSSSSFPAVVRSLYREGGIGQFFVGTGSRLTHVCSIITSQLVIYDMVKQMLGLPATGSH